MFACHMFVSFNMSFTSEIRVMGNELLRDQPFVAGQVVVFKSEISIMGTQLVREQPFLPGELSLKSAV